jgi:hypothetical protein
LGDATDASANGTLSAPFKQAGGVSVAELDNIIRMVRSDQPMTLAELRQATTVLGDCPMPRDFEVLAARLRVALRLEKLGVQPADA